MNIQHFTNSVWAATLAALLAVLLITITFLTLEPTVSRSQASDVFTVTQTVSGALAFAASTSDVTMNGTLNGLTGGTANGTTTVRVTTNNSAGYNMLISFSSTTAMIRNGATASEIKNYQYSTGTASYPSGYASAVYGQFGFTVNASNTAEVSDVFTYTGSTCGTGSNASFSAGTCWRGASSTDETGTTELINSSAPTPSSGSTSTVMFRVSIPNGPSPSVPDGTYVATATLTLFNN